MTRRRFSAKALDARLAEFGGCCADCGMATGGAAGLEWDHRVPVELGDSFEFDSARAQRIGNAAVHYGKNNGKRFAVRSLGNGRSRCWRVA